MRTAIGFILFLVLGFCGAASGAAYDDFLNAVKAGDARVAGQLLLRGMDPDTVDPSGQPVLHLAARSDALEVVKVLVGARADVDKRNGNGESAIMLAALNGHRSVVEFLLEKEAQINHPGWTPLLYAATNGHLQILKKLVEHHAYIDASSPNGLTSLMMAARGGHIDTVKFLLEGDADPGLLNDLGESALVWAERARNTDIAALLRARLKPQ